MSDPEKRNVDEQLEAYLDDQLDDDARQAFEARLREDDALAIQIESEAAINESLERQYPVGQPSDENMAAITAALADRSETVGQRVTVQFSSRGVFRLAVLATAAVVGWIAFTVVWDDGDIAAPFFEPRPLAQLYQESVANGFEPYYECRNDDRFIETFQRRQTVPLRLLPMPAGSSMLGLSYPGGLSRDTTAVLCRVGEAAVMVFVDRLERDQPPVGDSDQAGLNVFRHEQFGLVFYEVTPLESPQMIEFFARAGAN